MSTGDLSGNLERLIHELQRIHYPGKVDKNGLLSGSPVALLPIIHYAFLSYSKYLAQFLSSKGYEIMAKNDQRFMESVLKLLREQFSYICPLSATQILSPHFAERKILILHDILVMCREWHRNAVRDLKQRKVKWTEMTMAKVSAKTTSSAGKAKQDEQELRNAVLKQCMPRAKPRPATAGSNAKPSSPPSSANLDGLKAPDESLYFRPPIPQAWTGTGDHVRTGTADHAWASREDGGEPRPLDPRDRLLSAVHSNAAQPPMRDGTSDPPGPPSDKVAEWLPRPWQVPGSHGLRGGEENTAVFPPGGAGVVDVRQQHQQQQHYRADDTFDDEDDEDEDEAWPSVEAPTATGAPATASGLAAAPRGAVARGYHPDAATDERQGAPLAPSYEPRPWPTPAVAAAASTWAPTTATQPPPPAPRGLPHAYAFYPPQHQAPWQGEATLSPMPTSQLQQQQQDLLAEVIARLDRLEDRVGSFMEAVSARLTIMDGRVHFLETSAREGGGAGRGVSSSQGMVDSGYDGRAYGRRGQGYGYVEPTVGGASVYGHDMVPAYARDGGSAVPGPTSKALSMGGVALGPPAWNRHPAAVSQQMPAADAKVGRGVVPAASKGNVHAAAFAGDIGAGGGAACALPTVAPMAGPAHQLTGGVAAAPDRLDTSGFPPVVSSSPATKGPRAQSTQVHAMPPQGLSFAAEPRGASATHDNNPWSGIPGMEIQNGAGGEGEQARPFSSKRGDGLSERESLGAGGVDVSVGEGGAPQVAKWAGDGRVRRVWADTPALRAHVGGTQEFIASINERFRETRALLQGAGVEDGDGDGRGDQYEKGEGGEEAAATGWAHMAGHVQAGQGDLQEGGKVNGFAVDDGVMGTTVVSPVFPGGRPELA
eukprot:jgi/Mesvir1/21621/Mv04044-RA.1